MRIVTPRGRAADAAWAAEVTPKIVAILEDWFGTPYPYEKLDSVSIPMTSSFGAMENAGMITYRETRILIDPEDPGEDAKRRYAKLAAHELAHQWFGDLVTPAWWDDLWLNEAFATWMEEKAMAMFSPAWGLRVPVVVERDEALHADGLVSARRIRQPIASRDDIATAFDGITYDKGAAVIRMFEAWVGADAFQTGVRAYLAKHAGGVATSADFLAAIDGASDLDVTPAFSGFLDQAGAPRVGATMRCDGKKGPAVITLTQDRWLPRGSTPPAGEPVPSWTIPVCIAHGAAKTRQKTCTVLSGASAEIRIEGTCPTWFLPNADGKGYYRMGLDAAALDDLLDNGWKQILPHERVLLAGDVRAAVMRGELPIGAELDLVSRLVRDGSRHAIEMAVRIARDALAVAADGSRARLETWVLDRFGGRARKLGFKPDKGDGLDEELIRDALLPLVTEVARHDKLLDRAVELAGDWRTLPASSRADVLRAAVQTSAKVRKELLAAALAPADQAEAKDVFDALGAITDPDEAKAALAVLLDPAVDLKQGRLLLHGLADDPRTQPVAEAFLREHLAALLARMPAGKAADLVEVVTASCDAGKRADAATWARDHIEPLDGGVRTSAQALEQMDQCIARRAAMGPELEAWLEDRR
jgi:alanyl aminopeptidase